jgi:hypothetical protein
MREDGCGDVVLQGHDSERGTEHPYAWIEHREQAETSCSQSLAPELLPFAWNAVRCEGPTAYLAAVGWPTKALKIKLYPKKLPEKSSLRPPVDPPQARVSACSGPYLCQWSGNWEGKNETSEQQCRGKQQQWREEKN